MSSSDVTAHRSQVTDDAVMEKTEAAAATTVVKPIKTTITDMTQWSAVNNANDPKPLPDNTRIIHLKQHHQQQRQQLKQQEDDGGPTSLASASDERSHTKLSGYGGDAFPEGWYSELKLCKDGAFASCTKQFLLDAAIRTVNQKVHATITRPLESPHPQVEIAETSVSRTFTTSAQNQQQLDDNSNTGSMRAMPVEKNSNDSPEQKLPELRVNTDIVYTTLKSPSSANSNECPVPSTSPSTQPLTPSESADDHLASWKHATINNNDNTGLDVINCNPSAQQYTVRTDQHTKITFANRAPKQNEVISHHPLFVKDTSRYWYKPTISREEAINMLRDKPPGTFVVRDSNSFPGAFGLALKVATPPPGVHPGDGTELVRHFLIEPSPRGVKLKGCNNEPVFGTLSALVYQHSITPLALPAKLLLPEYDPATAPEHYSATQALLQQGAACNVTYLASVDSESLTGPEAVRRCVTEALELHKQKLLQPVSVHFKVSAQGVTVTDNTRRLFFRRHYPVKSVTFAGIDPSDRRWDNSYITDSVDSYVKSARIFAFVARKIGSCTDNACHVFAELEPEQPASAVVNFMTKVMMGRR